MNKYHAQRTHSILVGRTFDSKAEALRAEELFLLQRLGDISDLRFQVLFVLSEAPKVAIKIDFAYLKDGHVCYEDVKGVMTRDFRTKLAWLKQQGFEVTLIR